MSRARLAARFRDKVGTTPLSCLAEWGIGVAQSLLRRGTSEQLVADAVGHGNTSALSRAFTALKGVSASDWRKQYSQAYQQQIIGSGRKLIHSPEPY